MKKLENTGLQFKGILLMLFLIVTWQISVDGGWIERFLLPSPLDIFTALVEDFPILLKETGVTLLEALIGLSVGVFIGYLTALLMDAFPLFEEIIHPVITLTQVIPTIAIAPLLILWLGYGIFPKIVLILLTTFFPITLGVYGAFQEVDTDAMNLFYSMDAHPLQIYRYLKIPQAMGGFFTSLKIAVTYCLVTAVVSEWLGGVSGLGVYMLRVKKSFSFDKMFAVILIISVLSFLLMYLVELLRRRIMKWEELS